MSIYDQAIGFKFGFGNSKAMQLTLIAVVIILAAGAIGFFALQGVKPSALDLRFEKNPIGVGETVNVVVKVTNITKADAVNVQLSIRAKESSEFDIYPYNETFNGSILNLSKDTSREVTFVINPVGNILPGTYVLVAKTTVNGEEYEREAVLTVQP